MINDDDARVSARRGIAVPARVRVLSVWYDVEIRDLSRTGYRYATGYRFAAGQRALLKLAEWETMGGVIMWQGEGGGGIHFDRPLHEAVVEAIARKHPDLVG